MILLQRTRLLRTGGKQVIKWTAEGAVNDVTCYFVTFSILQRGGIRQLPEI